MKGQVIAAAMLFGLAGSAIAQVPPAAALPDGWTQTNDGSFSQVQSGVVCAKTLGAYNFVRLDAGASANELGTCIYSGGDVRVGKIRVRRFVDGVGETPLAIQNDRVLMGVEPMAMLRPAQRSSLRTVAVPGPTSTANRRASSCRPQCVAACWWTVSRKPSATGPKQTTDTRTSSQSALLEANRPWSV